MCTINIPKANAASLFGTFSSWFTGLLKGESTLDMSIVKDAENGKKAYVTVTDPNSTIIKLKLKKVATYDEKVDFTTQGDEIPITPGNTVEATIDVRDEGIYKIAAINSDNHIIIATVIFYTEYFMTMDLAENVMSPGEIQINANDTYFNIVKLKIAKTTDIENSGVDGAVKYFKEYGYGTDIPITPANTITTTYQVSENAYYTLYIEDERKNAYAKQVLINAIPTGSLTATINYSTETYTNKPVTATISFNKEDVVVTNNNGSTEYIFNDNGEFTFEYEDILGNNGSSKAVVTWIDKNPPVISNITSGSTYDKSITPAIEDDKSNVTVKLEKDGITINYVLGQEISENGNYILTATDEAGNEVKVSFKIEKLVNDSITSEKYIIKTDLIHKILPETKVSDFKNLITAECSYKILDANGNELTDIDFITTNSKLVLETGKEYKLLVLGDIESDGKITIKDLAKIQKVYLGIDDIENKTELIDLDGNNAFELKDIATIQKVYLKLMTLN